MSLRRPVARRAAAVAGAGMFALAALSACSGGGDGDHAGASPGTRTHVDDVRPTTAPHHRDHPHSHPPSTSQGGDDGPPTNSPDGAEFGESLPFGGLEVKALEYRKAGYRGVSSTRTRVDVVTVEECAEAGPAKVRHQTWRLVDADGRTLGVAGGKIINGHPTEDLPQTLYAGQCVTTRLAIGVPAGSTAVAVLDGPDATWVLAH